MSEQKAKVRKEHIVFLADLKFLGPCAPKTKSAKEAFKELLCMGCVQKWMNGSYALTKAGAQLLDDIAQKKDHL